MEYGVGTSQPTRRFGERCDLPQSGLGRKRIVTYELLVIVLNISKNAFRDSLDLSPILFTPLKPSTHCRHGQDETVLSCPCRRFELVD